MNAKQFEQLYKTIVYEWQKRYGSNILSIKAFSNQHGYSYSNIFDYLKGKSQKHGAVSFYLKELLNIEDYMKPHKILELEKLDEKNREKIDLPLDTTGRERLLSKIIPNAENIKKLIFCTLDNIDKVHDVQKYIVADTEHKNTISIVKDKIKERNKNKANKEKSKDIQTEYDDDDIYAIDNYTVGNYNHDKIESTDETILRDTLLEFQMQEEIKIHMIIFSRCQLLKTNKIVKFAETYPEYFSIIYTKTPNEDSAEKLMDLYISYFNENIPNTVVFSAISSRKYNDELVYFISQTRKCTFINLYDKELRVKLYNGKNTEDLPSDRIYELAEIIKKRKFVKLSSISNSWAAKITNENLHNTLFVNVLNMKMMLVLNVKIINDNNDNIYFVNEEFINDFIEKQSRYI
jgi:hypothetical protein